ncbi:MAG: hypothetical protein Q9222_002732 [Ikaeria aurantiellina]
MDTFLGVNDRFHDPAFTPAFSDEEFARVMGQLDGPLGAAGFWGLEEQQQQEPAATDFLAEFDTAEETVAQTTTELGPEKGEDEGTGSNAAARKRSRCKKRGRGRPRLVEDVEQPVEHEGPGNNTLMSPPQYLPGAEPKTRQPNTSKRAQKRAYFEKKDIPYGDDDRKKGQVEVRDGVLHVKIHRTWNPAVYHHDLRAEKIAEAPPHLYTHEPKHGEDPLDVTSYWAPHKDFGFEDRETRPPVLFEWIPSKEFHPKPDNMMDRGRIVIDIDNHPVIDYPIPFALSSEVEAGRLEFMSRSNGRHPSKGDFRARMPPTVIKKGEQRSLMTANSIGMRRIRFRDIAGLPAANPRQHSDKRKRALVQCIPPEIMQRILACNDTRCWRDLKPKEIQYIESVNRGTSLEKAGSFQITEKERKERQERQDYALRNLELANPTAYPYDEDMDDDKAVAVSRAALGLPPLQPKPPRRFTPRSAVEKDGPAMEDPFEPEARDRPYWSKESSVGKSMSVTPSNDGISKGRKRGRDEETALPNSSDDAPYSKRRYFRGDAITDDFQSHLPSSSLGGDLSALPATTDHPTIDENRNPAQYLNFMPRAPRENINESRVPLIDLTVNKPIPRPLGESKAEGWNRHHNPSTNQTPHIRRIMPKMTEDYRFKEPMNDEEKRIVAYWIKQAQLDVIWHLNICPNVLFAENACYMECWQSLQRWFEEKCLQRGAPKLWFCEKPWVNRWPVKEEYPQYVVPNER